MLSKTKNSDNNFVTGFPYKRMKGTLENTILQYKDKVF